MYEIELDITGGSDEEADPPIVYIIDEKGIQLLHVLEESISRSGKNMWDIDDWEPGPFAKKVLELLNASFCKEEREEV